MANENIDVIRVAAAEAAMGTTLRAGMVGFASDTDRMTQKKLADSSLRYWSDDSKQMLLAGNQTATGAKTFSGAVNLNGVNTHNGNSVFGAELICRPLEVSSITDGTTLLTLAGYSHIKITRDEDVPGNNTVGFGAGSADGQVVIISCSDRSALEITDSVPSSSEIRYINAATTSLELDSFENAVFMWCTSPTGAGDYWKLLCTTGNENIP